MDTLLNKYSSYVNGTIVGFDRIVLKGMIKPIMYAKGMESFLKRNGVLNKDFKDYVIKQSQSIVGFAEQYALSVHEDGITYIPSSNIRKEVLAHERQRKEKIEEGLIGVWSCVESCNTFKAVFSKTQSYPELKYERSKCKHLYFYFDDPTYGFMNIRLQTWAPYEIQIALNGREWLRRSLDKAGCGYQVSGNKFMYIEDYDYAQELLNAQTKVNLGYVLCDFLPLVFPRMEEIVPGLGYYVTIWQSEVAKDYIFEDSSRLNELMDDL